MHAAGVVVAAGGGAGAVGELHEGDAALEGGGLEPATGALPPAAGATAHGEVLATDADLAAIDSTEPEDVAGGDEPGEGAVGVVLAGPGHAPDLKE